MLKHRLYIYALLFLLVSVPVFVSAEGQRGIVPIPIKDRTGNQVLLYQESHALLVGVSQYTGGWPDLPGVREDINEVKVALEQKGFHTVIVMNPTRIELRDSIENFINLYGQDVDNRLIFYFAGHGHTMESSYGEEMGYFVPANAPNPNLDKSGFLATSINMESIEVYSKKVQSKHALFLFDSCFSGSIFALSRAIPENISFKTSKPVRQFITAGSANETVPDESIFNDQLIRALNGEGDLDGDGYLTGVELGEFLNKTVINYSKGSQHPQYGKIRNPNLDKGDFVFSLFDRRHIEQSIGSIVREREKLKKNRLNLEEERKRITALQRMQEEKQKLEDEKKRLKEEQKKMEAERESVAKIQSPKEQKNRERIPFENDGLDSILNSIKNKEELRRKKEEVAYKEFIKFNENLEGGLRSINKELARKNNLLINLNLDISKYNEIIGSDYGKDLKPQAWMELVRKYSELESGQSIGDTSGLLFVLKDKIANLENRRNLKRKELDSKLIMKFGNSTVYRKKVNSLLQEKIVDAPKGPRARTIVVSFSIIPNGKIKEIKLKQKTGNVGCDDGVLSDVIRSGPFPEFPAELMFPSVDIEYAVRVQCGR